MVSNPGSAHTGAWATRSADAAEALKVATMDGAYSSRIRTRDRIARQGKRADLVVLNSDPLRDIRSSADIAYG